MFYAERGNRVVSIKEDAIQRYSEMGYVITDDCGNIVKTTVPVDVPNLKKAYVEQGAKIKSLEAENENLKMQIAELMKAQQKPAKAAKVEAETPAENVPDSEIAEKSEKTTKRTKKAE